MVSDHTETWELDRRWANLSIAFLSLAIIALLLWRINIERHMTRAVPNRITAQARIAELQQAAMALADPGIARLLPHGSLKTLAADASEPWDRALIGILAAESSDLTLGQSLALDGPAPGGDAGTAFRRCFSAAYLVQGDLPGATDLAIVSESLRDGYAAHLLRARLLASTDPGTSLKLRDDAKAWAIPRLVGLALTGLAFTLLAPAGIVMIFVLACSSKKSRPFPMPVIQASGRTLTLVFLSWFLVFLLSGLLVSSLAMSAPIIRPITLPLTYCFHALIGFKMLCWMEDVSFASFLKRLMPGAHGKSLAWGFGFLALAVVMVLSVSLAMSPFIQPKEAPQRELMDLVSSIHGVLPLGMLFLTVSVVAPIFEECLFRGVLLPWLGHRLAGLMGERQGWITALLLTSLGFGLIHLQPTAMPVLSTLGLALGMAFLSTGHLGSAILIHGLWNGGVFVFYRVVLG